MKALAATMVFLSLTVVATAKPTPVSSLNQISGSYSDIRSE